MRRHIKIGMMVACTGEETSTQMMMRKDIIGEVSIDPGACEEGP
jgi:hypothetical protein